MLHTVDKEWMVDIHQNLGFVKTYLRFKSLVIDNRCKRKKTDLKNLGWTFQAAQIMT